MCTLDVRALRVLVCIYIEYSCRHSPYKAPNGIETIPLSFTIRKPIYTRTTHLQAHKLFAINQFIILSIRHQGFRFSLVYRAPCMAAYSMMCSLTLARVHTVKRKSN